MPCWADCNGTIYCCQQLELPGHTAAAAAPDHMGCWTKLKVRTLYATYLLFMKFTKQVILVFLRHVIHPTTPPPPPYSNPHL